MTLSDRLIAVFISLLFSAPIAGLLWLLFNGALIHADADSFIPPAYLGIGILCLAVVSFIFPKFVPAIFGWLANLFVKLARWM
jgi:hypothetical protein